MPLGCPATAEADEGLITIDTFGGVIGPPVDPPPPQALMKSPAATKIAIKAFTVFMPPQFWQCHLVCERDYVTRPSSVSVFQIAIAAVMVVVLQPEMSRVKYSLDYCLAGK